MPMYIVFELMQVGHNQIGTVEWDREGATWSYHVTKPDVQRAFDEIAKTNQVDGWFAVYAEGVTGDGIRKVGPESPNFLVLVGEKAREYGAGRVAIRETVKVDTPAGRICAYTPLAYPYSSHLGDPPFA